MIHVYKKNRGGPQADPGLLLEGYKLNSRPVLEYHATAARFAAKTLQEQSFQGLAEHAPEDSRHSCTWRCSRTSMPALQPVSDYLDTVSAVNCSGSVGQTR